MQAFITYALSHLVTDRKLDDDTSYHLPGRKVRRHHQGYWPGCE